MISRAAHSLAVLGNRRSDTNRKVLVKGVGENLPSCGGELSPAASGPSVAAWVAGLPVAAPGTGHRHIDLFCYLRPGQALVAQLQDLLS
jgi:hypothetical protein